MSDGGVPTLTARSRWAASIVVALILAAVAAVPTAPAALYGTYEHVDGFPTAMVTVVFSTGIVGVLIGMFVLGHVSDLTGRKRMLLVAVLVQLLALVVYAVSPGLEVLLVARVISGLGAGIAVPTATAYIVDLLDRRGAPDGARRAAILATAANLGGFALGPVICGLLAEFAPRPLSTTYVVLFVVLAVAIIPLLRLPETRERKPVTRAVFLPRFRVSPEHRQAVLAAGFAAFAGYAVIGLFGALAPVILRELFGQTDKLEGALLVGGVFGAAALGQVLLFGAPRKLQLAIGLAAVLFGLVMTTVGVLGPIEARFVLGGVIAGAGAGLLARAGMATVAQIDPESLPTFFVIAFLGFALPVVLVGLSTLAFPIQVVVPVFAALVAVLAIVTSLRVPLDRASGAA
jgi:MFS family permease